MMYATNFYIGRQPSRPDQVEVFTSRSGVKVYRNPDAFPRAWTAHEAMAVDRGSDGGCAGVGGVRSAPELNKCGEPETVSVVERQSGLVSLKANPSRGMVTDADIYFPGWVATVDGQPAPVYEAYGFLRGVVVEAGAHRIEMRYRPKSVYWGAALTALGLLGAGLLAAVKW